MASQPTKPTVFSTVGQRIRCFKISGCRWRVTTWKTNFVANCWRSPSGRWLRVISVSVVFICWETCWCGKNHRMVCVLVCVSFFKGRLIVGFKVGIMGESESKVRIKLWVKPIGLATRNPHYYRFCQAHFLVLHLTCDVFDELFSWEVCWNQMPRIFSNKNIISHC